MQRTNCSITSQLWHQVTPQKDQTFASWLAGWWFTFEQKTVVFGQEMIFDYHDLIMTPRASL